MGREPSDQHRAFLAERRYAVLATHDPDGGIHLTPIWFVFEDGCFFFGCGSGSRKAKNAERTQTASVVVDGRERGRERWVSAIGSVTILRDAEAQAVNARIRGRYLAPAALGGPIENTLTVSDDVTLRLQPTTWRSWSADLGDSPEQWFLELEP